MSSGDTLRLTIGLIDRAERAAVAVRLAQHVGAAAIFGLVQDPELGVLVPAPGFPKTLPGGRIWRELIELCAAPGLHRGLVPPAVSMPPEPAIACSAGGFALVFVGAQIDEAAVKESFVVLPALCSALGAEQEIAVAVGALRAAQEGARNAHALAQALDVARADLETKAQSLGDARERAEQATRAKDEFLAMLGHELRNPLAPILTALQLMRFRGTSSREQDVIERHVAHLMRLVDDLLDVSRITQGKIELRRECIELSRVASRAVEMASPLLEQRRQILDVRVAQTGLAVDADPERLSQVLANLLTNASRYSDHGRPIMLAAERDDDRIRIRVLDEGVGIERDMLSSIFGAFVQEARVDSSSRSGLGLGLAIVKSLVALHGGEVRAKSEGKGRGSELIVELPASTDDPALADPSRIAKLVDAPRGRATERVLVVDDNDDAADLLCDVLVTLGHQVRAAADGPAALALAREFRPTIALLDIGLPIMDGFELAERLRSQGGAAAPRMVAITGYGQETDRVRSRAAGFDAHLVKPVDLTLLQRVMAELSARRVIES